MNAPAAVISGTFVKIESIATRKLVRIHIECPVEQANQVLAALGGYPDAANPVHVAVARLNIEGLAREEPTQKKDRRPFAELPAPTQAALTCQEPRFWAFCREELNGGPISDEDGAASFVRSYCKVKSRSDLKGEAEHRWQFLVSGYFAWLGAEAA